MNTKMTVKKTFFTKIKSRPPVKKKGAPVRDAEGFMVDPLDCLKYADERMKKQEDAFIARTKKQKLCGNYEYNVIPISVSELIYNDNVLMRTIVFELICL